MSVLCIISFLYERYADNDHSDACYPVNYAAELKESYGASFSDRKFNAVITTTCPEIVSQLQAGEVGVIMQAAASVVHALGSPKVSSPRRPFSRRKNVQKQYISRAQAPARIERAWLN